MSAIIRNLSVALVTLAGIAPAAAQRTVPADDGLPPRVGFEGGFGVYAGEINCEDQSGNQCDGVTEAGGIDLHATFMFTPRLGLTFDVWPMVHTEDNWTFTHNVVTLGLKWRPVPILGLTAGLGSAQARLRYDGIVDLESRTEVAPAVLLAASVDVLRGRSFAIDVQARVGAGFYGADDDDDGNPDVVGRNVGLGVGFTWF